MKNCVWVNSVTGINGIYLKNFTLCYKFNFVHNHIGGKYVKMYENFISQLKMYANVIRVLSKGYLPIFLLPPMKLQEILNEVKKAI